MKHSTARVRVSSTIYTYIHIPSFILALLASFLYFKGCLSLPEKATGTSSIQTSSPFFFIIYRTLSPTTFFLTFSLFSQSSFGHPDFQPHVYSFTFKFHILLLFTSFEPSDVQLTLEHWGFTCGNISVDLSSDYSIEHLTDIFTKSFLTQVTKTFTDDKTNKEVSETKAYLQVRCF